MTKLDITISKDYTINTGNYSSIKPSISITIKDVDKSNIDNEYKKLSELTDAMIANEIITMSNEMEDIQKHNIINYTNLLEKSQNNIMKIIEEYSTMK